MPLTARSSHRSQPIQLSTASLTGSGNPVAELDDPAAEVPTLDQLEIEPEVLPGSLAALAPMITGNRTSVSTSTMPARNA